MSRFLHMRPGWAFALYAFLDLISVGIGMGVPIFCILLGFGVGCFNAWRAAARGGSIESVMRRSLVYALLQSAFTFLVMLVIWGRCLPMLFDPTVDLANFGIPMILYQPEASFIGWLVLMVLISPFLQLLTTVFASFLVLLTRRRGSELT